MSFFFYVAEDRVGEGETHGEASLTLFHEEGCCLLGKPRALSYQFSFAEETPPLRSLGVLRDALLSLGVYGVEISAGSLVLRGKKLSRDRYFEKEGRFFHRGTLFYSGKTPQLAKMEAAEGLTMTLLVGAVKYQFERCFGKSAETEAM